MTSESFRIAGKRVWVAGHRGMVGRAIVRRLERENCEIIAVDRAKIDLRDQNAVMDWMIANSPDVVFLAAAKVGGIKANDSFPAEFLYDNLVIETNVIEGARRAGVAKLVFLGSSCIYPKFAPQPMSEDTLLTGPLESTNEWYAIAKIAGIKLCQAYRRQYGCDFISAQPTNLYGPFDNFDLAVSHVLPALMRKAHEAKAAHADMLPVWGSGNPLREFLHVDDLADALVFLTGCWSSEEIVNIGTGDEVRISDLAAVIAKTVGFEGSLTFDATQPDGTPRKLLDATRLRGLGWAPAIPLEKGIRDTYAWFRDHIADARL